MATAVEMDVATIELIMIEVGFRLPAIAKRLMDVVGIN